MPETPIDSSLIPGFDAWKRSVDTKLRFVIIALVVLWVAVILIGLSVVLK